MPEIVGEGCLSDNECPDGNVCNVLGVCAPPTDFHTEWLETAAIRVESFEVVSAEQVTVALLATAPGSPPSETGVEVCASESDEFTETRSCVRVPFRLGQSTVMVRGLRGGKVYDVTPHIVIGVHHKEGEAVAVLTRPDVVEGVRASDGSSPEYVALGWERVAGAETYGVLRDGVWIGETTATTFVDLYALPGGTPGPVERLVASPGSRADAVELAWQPASVTAGQPHVYTVVAVNASGEGLPSAPDSGFRAGPPVLEYVLVPGDRAPIELGGATDFVDTGAPSGRLEFGELEVSRGDRAGAITAMLPLRERTPGAEVTYTLVAVNAAGFGPARQVTGRRAPPSYAIAWEVEQDAYESGRWISVGHTERQVEVELAPRSVRRVRALVSTDLGAAVYSGRGWAGECEGESECGDGEVCDHGFCVPPGYVFVPAHAHRLGSTQPSEYGREASEAAFVAVFEHSRLFGETEVMQAQWREVMGSVPSYFVQCGNDCPVENVSWGSALAYCNALSVRDGLAPCYDLAACTGDAATGELVCERDPGVLAPDGDVYACEGWRLPTGYEWEWAARGLMDAWDESWLPTPEAPDCRSSLSVDHQAFAQTCASPPQGYPGAVCGSDRYCRGTIPVASLLPSPWGLFDVAGNVWEWTWGRQAPVPPADSVVVEPLPIGSTAGNVSRRGAAWNWRPYHARLGKLSWVEPGYRANDTGFRVVRTVR